MPLVADAWVGRSVASVTLCVCVCPRNKRETTWAINTKAGTHVLHGKSLACFEP